MGSTRRLWFCLGAVFLISFFALGLIGRDIFVNAPPVPDKVVSESGKTIFTRADIESGREVWQTLGGMELGSIWGHGGYVAPDWSADWLHREATAILDGWASQKGVAGFASLGVEDQAALTAKLKRELRPN